MLFFENLSGVKEDEYFRDGVTEDIITELSKIRGLNTFSRPTVLAFRDKPVTPAQIGQQLGAAYVLAGSLRRAGARLRINAQLVDTRTDFPLWSERYDREMRGCLRGAGRDRAQDRRGAAHHALAAGAGRDLGQADRQPAGLRSLPARQKLRAPADAAGPRVRACRCSRARSASIRGSRCLRGHRQRLRAAPLPSRVGTRAGSIARATPPRRPSSLQPHLPEAHVGRGWVFYANKQYDEAVTEARMAIAQKSDCEGVYYMLGRALFAAGRYQEIIEIADEAVRVSGSDYNIYVPIINALKAQGKSDAERHMNMRRTEALETHLREVPDDARARMQLAITFASLDRADDAMREANLATMLRPNEPTVLYNAACTFCMLARKPEALQALKKAWDAGFKDAVWARRDPDLAILHGEPEFERLYLGNAGGTSGFVLRKP